MEQDDRALVVDTHAHLDFEAFDVDRAAVIERAAEAGVGWIVNVGSDLAASQRAVELAATHSCIYAAVGVHPHDAKSVTPALLSELRSLAQAPKVLAIGEIGLDYYRDRSPRDVQRAVFRRQLELADELKLPVIIHNRDAHEDVLAALEEWKPAHTERRGVFHAFSGDGPLARRAIELGFYLALGGPLTFTNAHRMPALVPHLPLDRLLVETDCPFLTPHPHRGKRNEPAYVRLVVEKLAEILALDVAEVARQTTANARALFGLEECSQPSG